MRFRDVVEGHHDDAEKQHRRDGPNPVPVSCEHSVLVGSSGPSHQLQRAEIRRDEAESRDPGSHLAAGQEKLFACPGRPLHIKADEEYDYKIKDKYQNVDRCEMGELRSKQDGQGGHGFSITDGSMKFSRRDLDAHWRSWGSTSASLKADSESSPNAK